MRPSTQYIPNAVCDLRAYYHGGKLDDAVAETRPVIAWEVRDVMVPVIYDPIENYADTDKGSTFVGCFADPTEGELACQDAIERKSKAKSE